MGEYVQLETVRMWYHEQGEGEPLVLLHGGVVDASFFDENIGALASRFRVYAVDLRGHGHTGDVEGPFSYDALSQDMIEFLEQVVRGPAHLVGHSVGGAVAMFVAMKRPELVSKLVMASSGFHYSCGVGYVEGADPVPDIEPVVAAFGPAYGAISPDGESHYPVVVRKVFEMNGQEPSLTAADLGVLAHRSLLLYGDDDILKFEHVLEMYGALPNAELAIVPGTTHFLFQEKPGVCNDIIVDFLANDPVPVIAPVRRAPAAAPA